MGESGSSPSFEFLKRKSQAALRGLLLLPALLLPGCDPCVPNPCDDGQYCNGSETCRANGGEAICGPGQQIECDDGQVCNEVIDLCVFNECERDDECDDNDDCTFDVCVEGGCQNGVDCDSAAAGCTCNDGDLCTENDVCGDGACAGTPRTCPEGELCDSTTGQCIPDVRACCQPSGICADLSLDDCALAIGTSGELGSTCDTQNCQTGACCLESGVCSILTENACAESQGSYKGDDTDCDAFDCTTGACCLDEDSCVVRSSTDCTADAGQYQGGGTPCDNGTCGAETPGIPCCVDNSCEFVSDTECTEMGGTPVAGQTDCPPPLPDDVFAHCAEELVGVWSMAPYDPESGVFLGSSRPYYFLSDGSLVEGTPTIVQTGSGPFSFFYQLYTSFSTAGNVVTATGCAQPPSYPSTRPWTVRTISEGELTIDRCTGECILSFKETLNTTHSDGTTSETITNRRSTGRGDVEGEFCYRSCIETCNAAYLPGSCFRTPPDPPYSTDYGDFDEWLQGVLDSRTCAQHP